MNFKDYYKFPLVLDEYLPTKVWTDDGSMAFDFANDILASNEPYAKFTGTSAINIVNCLNGKYTMRQPHTYIRKNENIYIKLGAHKLLFIVLRGWGNLTGRGSHALSDKKAAKIQDAFGDFIIQKLTEKEPDKNAITVG